MTCQIRTFYNSPGLAYQPGSLSDCAFGSYKAIYDIRTVQALRGVSLAALMNSVDCTVKPPTQFGLLDR